MTTIARYHPVHNMLPPAWLAHTIVNDFLIFSIQGGGQSLVSQSLSLVSPVTGCVCVCVCVSRSGVARGGGVLRGLEHPPFPRI